MRLLNTRTLELKEFIDTQQVRYSILSHCWSQDPEHGEVTFQEFSGGTSDSAGRGWQKIQRCCTLSQSRGLEWTWVDTCCIDKSSSAEMTETINSMYAWYQVSAGCYVFMDDCTVEQLPRQQFEIDKEGLWKNDFDHDTMQAIDSFASSRWFTRGWTLQELVGPEKVLFYNSNGTLLGMQTEILDILHYATGVDQLILVHASRPQDFSIAERMSWAASRVTSRPEDVAYCLLGIFDVNMPLLYGEGNRAFMRLQQEIMQRSDDQSILAWELDVERYLPSGVPIGMLATSPAAFKSCENVRALNTGSPLFWINRRADFLTYASTNRGIAISHTSAALRLATRDTFVSRDWLRYATPQGCLGLKCAVFEDDFSVGDPIYLYLEYYSGAWYRMRCSREAPGPTRSWGPWIAKVLFAFDRSPQIIFGAVRSQPERSPNAQYAPRPVTMRIVLLRMLMDAALLIRGIPAQALLVSTVVLLLSQAGHGRIVIVVLAAACSITRFMGTYILGGDEIFT